MAGTIRHMAEIAETSSAKKDIEQLVWQSLETVIDPELFIDIVSLGLIYRVTATELPEKTGWQVHIVMTLTTPGCPLAGVFDGMVRGSLVGIPNLDTEEDVSIDLTFDPPWVPDMMSEEAKAELGFD